MDPDDAPEQPAPEVVGTKVERDGDGDVQKVVVSVTYWDQDSERTVDIPFTFGSQRDPDAVFLSSVKRSGSYIHPRRDMVPFLVAERALLDLDAVDVGTRPVTEAMDQAAAQAERAFQDDGE